MAFTLLLILGPLTGLAVIPLVRQHWRPPVLLAAWLGSPWRALPILVLGNALALLVTIGLAFLPVPLLNLTLPGFGGPVLCVAFWTASGMTLGFQGARRWLVALAGMLPFWLVAGAAWQWLQQTQAAASPETDMFHAALGVAVLTAVTAGATLMGTLVTVLNGPRRGV